MAYQPHHTMATQSVTPQWLHNYYFIDKSWVFLIRIHSVEFLWFLSSFTSAITKIANWACSILGSSFAFADVQELTSYYSFSAIHETRKVRKELVASFFCRRGNPSRIDLEEKNVGTMLHSSHTECGDETTPLLHTHTLQYLPLWRQRLHLLWHCCVALPVSPGTQRHWSSSHSRTSPPSPWPHPSHLCGRRWGLTGAHVMSCEWLSWQYQRSQTDLDAAVEKNEKEHGTQY